MVKPHVRAATADDHALFIEWHAHRGRTLNPAILPATTYVLELDGVRVAALSLCMIVGSPCAYLEHAQHRPGATPAESRSHFAILAAACIAVANAHDYSTFQAITSEPIALALGGMGWEVHQTPLFAATCHSLPSPPPLD
jgi:hypothetical protein